MSDSALPEDPLVALFGPAFTDRARLSPSGIELGIELTPPSARVVVTRRFINRGDATVEAVLTLPLPARGETVRAVTVIIDGVARGNDEHHTIAYELIEDRAQIIAVSRIATGSEVVVRLESVRTLDLLGNHLASLVIPLGADAGPVTLAVVGDGVAITAQGREHRAASGVAVAIGPAAQVAIGIRTTDGRTLRAAKIPASDESSSSGSARFVFPSSAGAARDDGASFRALARAELSSRDLPAPPSADDKAEPVILGPSLPEHPDPKMPHMPQMPDARAPTYRWLDVSLAVVVALWLLHASHLIRPRIPFLFTATVVILLIDALRSFPGQGRRVRRRLPLLLVLCIPWIVALVLGPLGAIATNGDPNRVGWMTALQEGALVVSVLLPFALLPFMRHARRFTLDVGALNAIATLVVSSVSLLVISPGS